MQKISIFILTAFSLFLTASCTEEKKGPQDTLTSGSVNISVDETYRPVIEDELRVFDSSYPDAHISARYKSEAECIKDFLNDSVRLILVTRDLLPEEKKFLENKKVVATSLAVAKDAVAVVLHPAAKDSLFSVDQLKSILTGNFSKKYTVVFDNQGSSTLRYMQDSLLQGQPLGSNVFAAKSNDSVIEYVANNPEAIGFVGVSYVSDFSDPEGLAFTSKVKVAEVYNTAKGRAFAPYQAYIAPNWYPLTRKLYYIHRETYPGLGTGFANFLAKDRGQLIFKQSRLFPLRSEVIFREANVSP